MIKQILSVAMALILLAMLLPLEVISVSAQEYSVIDINDEADFIEFVNTVRDYYNNNGQIYGNCIVNINADLDFSDMSELKWAQQIGCAQVFAGIIDGKGHKIKGLRYNSADMGGNASSLSYAGILGGKIQAGEAAQSEYDGAYAGVFNLALENCEFISDVRYSGLLFGSAGNAAGKILFKNVYVNGEIQSSANVLGGLLGCSQSPNLEIINCAFDGTVSSLGSYVGGLIGHNGISRNDVASLKISNCAVYGRVSGAEHVGALVGANGKSSNSVSLNVENIVCAAEISGDANTALLAGSNSSENSISASNVIVSDKTAGVDFSDAQIYRPIADSALKGIDATQIPPEFVALPEGYAMPCGIVNFMRDKWVLDAKSKRCTAYVGYQRALDTSDEDIQIRLAAVLNDGDVGASLEGFSAVGFDIQMTRRLGDGALRVWNNIEDGESPKIKTVYKSLRCNNESRSAETLGGDYIFAAKISGIKANSGELIITVKTFHYDESGTKKYGDVAVVMFDTDAKE